MAIDYTKLKPYVMTLTRATKSKIDYPSMIKAGVSGVVVEAGYLYDTAHKEVAEFRNPKAYIQVEDAIKHNLPIGWLLYGKARNVKEAEREMYQFSFQIRKYAPGLGAWIYPEFTSSITTNDAILDTYQKELVRLGLKGKIGLKCTLSQLNQITWSNKQHDWNLWLVDRVSSLDSLNKLLTPEFFDVGGKYV